MKINVKIHNVKTTEMTAGQVKELLDLCCHEFDKTQRNAYFERKLNAINEGEAVTVSSNGQQYTLTVLDFDQKRKTKSKLTTLFY